MQRSSVVPFRRCWISALDVNILLLTSHVNYPQRTIQCNTPLKLEVIFCVRGVLSPLLANILLHQLDLELEHRGHRFARYADDLIVLVKSRHAGERVMGSLTRYLEHSLKLKVNFAKSKVALISECSFQGFTIRGKKIRWTEKSQANFKHRIKELTGRSWGVSMAYRRESEVSDPARCQQQELLAHGQNPGDPTGVEQHMVGSAGATQRERPVVQGPGLHAEQNFVAHANLLNRPLRTRTVGGVGAGGRETPGYPISRHCPHET